MSYELKSKIEKQQHTIELLERELEAANEALEERIEFAAALELDLENAIQLLGGQLATQ